MPGEGLADEVRKAADLVAMAANVEKATRGRPHHWRASITSPASKRANANKRLETPLKARNYTLEAFCRF